MSTKVMAAAYLRYLFPVGRQWILSDNAPTDFARYWASAIAHTDPAVIQRELTELAGESVPPPANDTAGLLKWYAQYPAAASHVDKILSGRQPPKFLQTALLQGYLAECDAVRASLREFFKTKIAEFE